MSEADRDPLSADALEAPASGEAITASSDESEPPTSTTNEIEPDSSVRASEDDASKPKRRSSIRPVAPDWRPPPRSPSGRPRPMVVVYSGESERPAFSLTEDEASADTVPPPTPRASLPFLLTRDLAPPPVPNFSDLNAGDEPGRNAELERRDRKLAAARTADDAPAVAIASDGESTLSEPAKARASRAPEPAPSKSRWPLLLAASLGAGAAVALIVQQQRQRTLAETSVAAKKPLVANVAAATSVPPLPVPMPVPSVTAEPVVDEPAAVQARPTSTLVVLDVLPPDAKVAVKGVQQHGPPFVFDIPPGKRVAVEVMRRGFVTRRAVIDGSSPRVTVGLLSVKVAHWRDNLKASAPGAKRTDGAKDPEAPVQSGL